tara:strand:+ start:1658 stop:1972 length:315 start_codon:yes stop_codon:yes gene_type:complete
MSTHGQHTKSPGYQQGNHWVECQRCGFDYREDNMRMEWTGLKVCGDCWEIRHPQDFVRGVEDNQAAQGIVNTVQAEITTDVTYTAAEGVDGTVPTGTFPTEDTL